MVVISESANEHKRVVQECLEKDFEGCVAAGVLVSARDALEGQIAGILGTTSLYVVLFGAAWDRKILPQLVGPLLLAASAIQAICILQFIMIIRQADRTNPYGEKGLWKAKAIIFIALHALWAVAMVMKVSTDIRFWDHIVDSFKQFRGHSHSDPNNASSMIQATSP